MPVLDENRTRLRIVIDEDGARYALWVDRSDASPAPVAPIQLADRDGRAPATAGVWLAPGAIVELGERAGRSREIIVRDDVVRARGWVPPGILGEVWPASPPSRSPGVSRRIAAEVPIRAAPDASAPPVAVTETESDVVLVSRAQTYSGWHEIELTRPFVRVRGFVPAGSLRDTGSLDVHGSGSGHGFGMSHSDFVTVEVGACLFDQAGGEVVGVNLAAKQRHAHRPDPEHPGWWRIYVDSPWSAIIVWVHDQSSDPQVASWESCGTYAR